MKVVIDGEYERFHVQQKACDTLNPHKILNTTTDADINPFWTFKWRAIGNYSFYNPILSFSMRPRTGATRLPI